MAFDEHAERYDGWFMKNENILASEVLLIKHFLLRPGRVLSVGCGSGLFEWLLKRDHGIDNTEGIEPSEAMAEIARKRGINVTNVAQVIEAGADGVAASLGVVSASKPGGRQP